MDLHVFPIRIPLPPPSPWLLFYKGWRSDAKDEAPLLGLPDANGNQLIGRDP